MISRERLPHLITKRCWLDSDLTDTAAARIEKTFTPTHGHGIDFAKGFPSMLTRDDRTAPLSRFNGRTKHLEPAAEQLFEASVRLNCRQIELEHQTGAARTGSASRHTIKLMFRMNRLWMNGLERVHIALLAYRLKIYRLPPMRLRRG